MKSQERIFKYLWKEKCWHKLIAKEYAKGYYNLKCSCGARYNNGSIDKKLKDYLFSQPINDNDSGIEHLDPFPNPDLTNPQGMSMILKRLVEMGYGYTVSSSQQHMGKTNVQINNYFMPSEVEAFMIHTRADSPELAVFNATLELVKGVKNEKN